MILPLHDESRALLATTVAEAFAYLDDFRALSAHMEKRSAMMLGSSMRITTDELGGRAVGSKVRMHGRMLGIALSLEEVVIEREPPRLKAWETREVRLLVMGQYRLGFQLTPAGRGSLLRVFIDYEAPSWTLARPLGRALARMYARWCTRRMARDAVHQFGGKVDLSQTPPVRQ